MSRIAVMIPCYNEEKAVGKVVSDFRKKLPNAEIYVFDNNSSDKTSEIAKESGATVINVPNKGKGNVVRAMFRKVEAEVYIMVDGDDTYPPDNIEAMIQPVIDGEADMVVGDRLSSSYFSENKRRFHNGGNIMMRRFINFLFKSNLHDILSGYRVFSHDFVKSIDLKSSAFEVETELTAFALIHKFDIKEIVVPYKDRESDNPSKLNTLKDGAKIIKTYLRIVRDYKPSIFFSSLAGVIALSAVILLVPVFNDYFQTGLVDRFPTLIFGCFLLIAALLLFCSGIILQVINNILPRLK